jgi:hypothetical protein
MRCDAMRYDVCMMWLYSAKKSQQELKGKGGRKIIRYEASTTMINNSFVRSFVRPSPFALAPIPHHSVPHRVGSAINKHTQEEIERRTILRAWIWREMYLFERKDVVVGIYLCLCFFMRAGG